MDDLEARAWIALVATSQLLPSALDQQLQADSDLTHFEYMALGMLGLAAQHAMRITDLASATNATLPRLSKVLARLDGRGLVERAPSPSDGRTTIVSLTRAGRKAWLNSTPNHIAMARHCVLDKLSREQLESLADTLEVIVHSLDPHSSLGFVPNSTHTDS